VPLRAAVSGPGREGAAAAGKEQAVEFGCESGRGGSDFGWGRSW